MAALLGSARQVVAQTPDPVPPAAPVTDEGSTNSPAQNLVDLPTNEAMRRFGHHFRITHRFARDLGRGDLGQLAEDLFGLDNGAIIGLDYRFSPLARAQVGFYRSTLFRTIQLGGRYDAWRQREGMPVGLSVTASVEGTNNMRDHHAPALGAVLSHRFGSVASLYASPTFVWHSVTPLDLTGHEGHDHEHEEPSGTGRGSGLDEENTGYVGLGARVRVPHFAAVVLEFAPRVAGFAPGRGTWGVAIEKETRGHLFQLNLSNSFGTTVGQLARGGDAGNVYLGFNLARRF